MFPRPNGRVKIQNLKARPGEQEVKDMTRAATVEAQTQFDYVWTSERTDSKFMVSIKRVTEPEPSFSWTLYEDASPQARCLWSQTTTDQSILLAKIEETCPTSPNNRYQPIESLNWEEQCRTFDGTDEVPIIELDQLRRIDEPSALSGELSLVDIANVLNSISMSSLSGRLSIDAKQRQADIFFVDGEPVHASGTMGGVFLAEPLSF